MPKVYLAGPISGQSYKGATSWRDYATEVLYEAGIEGLSPLRAKSYLREGTQIADSYEEHVLSTRKGITTRDRFDTQRADVVLVNLLDADRVSIGTMIELGWADAARNPIVLVLPQGEMHDHAMVREVAGFIVNTLEEGLNVTKAILS